MSRLQRFPNLVACYLGRCPRLLHYAPLVLIRTPARYFDESSMSLPLKRLTVVVAPWTTGLEAVVLMRSLSEVSNHPIL